MLTSTSRPYHHGDLKSALVDAAKDMLADRPESAIGLREVARIVGVSPAAPYRHFKNKNALMAAVAARGFEKLGEALQAAKPKSLKAIGHAYINFALAYPNLFGLMLGQTRDMTTAPDLTAAADKTYELLKNSVSGLATDIDPRIASAGAWALAHGLAILIADQQFASDLTEGPNRDQLIETALTIFETGLRAKQA